MHSKRRKDMSTIDNKFILSNQTEVPWIGFGTYNAKGGDNLLMIKTAIEAGYRYFDTASLYGTERVLGQAVKESGIPREEFIIASKVWHDEMGYDNTKLAFSRSLERLQTEYLDLYLIHWPKASQEDENWKQHIIDTWRAMEELVEEGKIKAIGLSNFLPHHLDVVLQNCRIKPVVDQLEVHPGYLQTAACEYAKENGILLQAWSPLARGQVQEGSVLQSFADKYGVSVAKLCLRYLYQRGIMPLVKASSRERMLENTDIFGFEISDEDCKMIACMPQQFWSGEHPDFAIPKARSNPNQ